MGCKSQHDRVITESNVKDILRVEKSRELVKIMTSPDSAMDLARSIFGVSEVDAVCWGRVRGLVKRLVDSAIR